MTIVVGERHIGACMKTLPQWWGIWDAVATNDGVKFGCWREPTSNSKIAADRVVQLLWKNEVRKALKGIAINPPLKTN
jgi:hypothetical protein